MVLLDYAVLLMHSLHTEPRHLVELLKCADSKEDIICFGSSSLPPTVCWAWTAPLCLTLCLCVLDILVIEEWVQDLPWTVCMCLCVCVV